MMTEPASPTVSSPILLKVHISDASGQPVDGAMLRANVSLGSLSSGAQQLVLEGRGRGDYQGWLVLDEAGRWDVNLVGTKDGQSREQGLTIDVERRQEPPTETLSPDPSTGN